MDHRRRTGFLQDLTQSSSRGPHSAADELAGAVRAQLGAVFPAPGDHPNVHSPDPYWAMIIAGGWNVGTWRRTIRSDLVRVEARLAPSVGADHRDAVEAAAIRLAAFLGRRLDFAHRP